MRNLLLSENFCLGLEEAFESRQTSSHPIWMCRERVSLAEKHFQRCVPFLRTVFRWSPCSFIACRIAGQCLTHIASMNPSEHFVFRMSLPNLVVMAIAISARPVDVEVVNHSLPLLCTTFKWSFSAKRTPLRRLYLQYTWHAPLDRSCSVLDLAESPT